MKKVVTSSFSIDEQDIDKLQELVDAAIRQAKLISDKLTESGNTSKALVKANDISFDLAQVGADLRWLYKL